MATAQNLTPQQRAESARKAAAARWAEHKKNLKAMDKGLAGIERTGKKLEALTAKARAKAKKA